MTGQEMYELYRLEMLYQNCEAEGWFELEFIDQVAWDNLAEKVTERLKTK